MMKKKLFGFLLLVFTNTVFAQQDPQYSQYMFNSLVINPAYAGYKETLNLTSVYRSQWQGVNGAPKTQTVIVDGSFADDRVGLALGVVNDKAGLRGKFLAYLNYSYKIKMGDNSRLAFGLSGGVAQYSYDGSKATYEEMQTPDFTDGRYTYLNPDARVGLHYSSSKFYVGFSATNLMANILASSDNIKNTIVTEEPHFFLTAGYLFPLNDFIKFKPSVLLKEDVKGPTSADFNMNFLVADKIWIGASYRANVKLWEKSNLVNNKTKGNGIIGILQFNAEKWNVGYSYDYSVSSLKSFNASHEVSVGIVLNKKKDLGILSPRYF